MNCGEEIRVKDAYGAHAVRFIAQCHGRFLVISFLERMNGYFLPNWEAVLRELVALTVPERMPEKILRAESGAAGRYNDIPLSYPLSIAGLAGVLGVTDDEIRTELADLAVQTAR